MDRWLFAVVLAACGGGPSATKPDETRPLPDAPTARATFQRCTGRAYTPAADEGWRHTIATPIITAAGAPNHSGADIVAHPGTAAALPGKFSYGLISKDLEDEDILVSIDDCQGWQPLGRMATNGDGRMAVSAPVLPTGVYEVKFQVAGDQSLTTSYLWLLPAGTHVVVTDIDATLTTNDSEVFQQILDGSYVPATYPNAVALTKAHEARGQVVVYMTGRPYWLSGKTRDYLETFDFAHGPVRLADSSSDILPTEGSVGAYKLAKLRALLGAGIVIDFAYGNATTDIYAYLGAGVPACRRIGCGSSVVTPASRVPMRSPETGAPGSSRWPHCRRWPSRSTGSQRIVGAARLAPIPRWTAAVSSSPSA
jgi:hypothetical protein